MTFSEIRIVFFVVLLGINSIRAQVNCSVSDPTTSRYLPSQIGIKGSRVTENFQIPCDTTIVRLGDTTRIYPGVRLYFGAKDDVRKVILIKGVLIAEGLTSNPILFSGSIKEENGITKPGPESWGGFRVEQSGSLTLKNSGIYQANQAINSQSNKVKLGNVRFRGCMLLIKPDGSQISLEYKGTDIQELNFSSATFETTMKSAKNKKRRNRIPWIIGTSAIGLVAISGTTFFLLPEKKQPVIFNFPTLPGDPGTWQPRR